MAKMYPFLNLTKKLVMSYCMSDNVINSGDRLVKIIVTDSKKTFIVTNNTYIK